MCVSDGVAAGKDIGVISASREAAAAPYGDQMLLAVGIYSTVLKPGRYVPRSKKTRLSRCVASQKTGEKKKTETLQACLMALHRQGGATLNAMLIRQKLQRSHFPSTKHNTAIYCTTSASNLLSPSCAKRHHNIVYFHQKWLYSVKMPTYSLGPTASHCIDVRLGLFS